MLGGASVSAVAVARRRVAAFGSTVNPQIMLETVAAYGPLHAGCVGDRRDVKLIENQRYGPSERQVMNLFIPSAPDGDAPIFIFVHGGGFVEGAPRLADTPFYDNIGYWAAGHGMVGVVVGYRLVPEATWPAVTDDIEHAIEWLRASQRCHGGNTGRIFVMGSSAGAIAVADLLGRYARRPASSRILAGAILRSGLYDFTSLPPETLRVSLSKYFGGDPAALAARSPALHLGQSNIPLMVLTVEHDPDVFHEQAAALVDGLRKSDSAPIVSACLNGHNHFSPELELNTHIGDIGDILLNFIEHNVDECKI